MISHAWRFFSQWLVLARDFAADRRGVTAIEYGLIAGCVSVAFVAIAFLLGDDVGGMFTDLANAVSDMAEGG